jgi:hypothetical protein
VTHIFRHVHVDLVRWHVFHGPNRKLDLEIISSAGIILTTYDVVVAEYQKPAKSGTELTMFSLLWRRVILDEGEWPTPLVHGTNPEI